MRKVVFIAIIMIISSCEKWDDDEDYRNHLRDKHPYAELIEIDLDGPFTYRVNDTIKNEIWIYTASRSSEKGYCVNCLPEHNNGFLKPYNYGELDSLEKQNSP